MKVLIIDDDNLSIFIAEEMLLMEEKITEVNKFNSAQDALLAFQKVGFNVPDVVFLDLDMPIVDGWEFLEAFNPIHAAFNSRCSVYILTSSLNQAETDRSKDYPMVAGVLQKPLTEAHIKMVIDHTSAV